MASPFERDRFLRQAPTTIEGVYTTYNFAWRSAAIVGFAGWISQKSHVTANELYACIIDDYDIYWVNMTTTAVVREINVSEGDQTEFQGNDHSALGTYSAHVSQPFTWRILRGYVDNALALNVNIAPDNWYGCIVSPSGRYIVTVRTFGGGDVVEVYEGA